MDTLNSSYCCCQSHSRAAQWAFKQLLLLNISTFCAVFWFPNEKMAELSCREKCFTCMKHFSSVTNCYKFIYYNKSSFFSWIKLVFFVALCLSMNKKILWNWLSWTCHEENLLKAHSCASLQQVRKKFDHFKYNNSSESGHLFSLPTAYVLNYLSREQQQRSPDLRLPSHLL